MVLIPEQGRAVLFASDNPARWLFSMINRLITPFYIFITTIFITVDIPAQASPKFIFPVDCTLGVDCWTVNYLDMDPTAGVADFKCGHKTYDGHKGTDFAIRSLAEMRAGVAVIAAMDGTVLRLRDSEPDTIKTKDELEVIRAQRKECGNAVVLNHGRGLTTLYCHMKKGSITVLPKEMVKAGDKIGEIGLSGFTEFPHMHFTVIRDGKMIDPYSGAINTAGCGQHKQSLWAADQPMAYEPVAIYDGGFRTQVPDFDSIKRGEKNPQTLSSEIPALVFWTAIYGIKKGDRVDITTLDPSGEVFTQRTVVQNKDRARQYYYTGRKINEHKLEPGVYKGRIHIYRDEDVQAKRDFRITIKHQQ